MADRYDLANEVGYAADSMRRLVEYELDEYLPPWLVNRVKNPLKQAIDLLETQQMALEWDQPLDREEP